MHPHPSRQIPPRKVVYKHDLHLVDSPHNDHTSDILENIAVLHPVCTSQKFTDVLVVFSYDDAPTNPFPARNLRVISFIEGNAFEAFVSTSNPLRQYTIAVKEPHTVTTNSDYRNSCSFSKLASYLRSSRVVAILAEGSRIGFLLPNERCNHSASVFFCTNDEAKQRIRALQREEDRRFIPDGLRERWIPPSSSAVQGQLISPSSLPRKKRRQQLSSSECPQDGASCYPNGLLERWVPTPSSAVSSECPQDGAIAQLVHGVESDDAASEHTLVASVSDGKL